VIHRPEALKGVLGHAAAQRLTETASQEVQAHHSRIPVFISKLAVDRDSKQMKKCCRRASDFSTPAAGCSAVNQLLEAEAASM
jgi:hypothetical protein